MGGLLTYKAGILNIALDGFMILAAFCAFIVASSTGSLALGIIAAVAVSMIVASVLISFSLTFRADIFIAGIALTFIAYGMTALLLESVFHSPGLFTSSTIPTFPAIHIPLIGDIPVVGRIVSGHTLLVYVAYASIPAVYWLLFKTQWGLRLRIIGEAEGAAAAAGVNVNMMKVQAMVASGFFCGLGGAYISLGYLSLFSNQMTADRGLIAVAAIIFARGNPYGTALVGLMFALASALAIRLPEVTGLAPQLLQLIPYLVTVVALLAVGIRHKRGRSKHGSWNFEL